MKKKELKRIEREDVIKFIKYNISYVITILVIVILFNIKLPYYIHAPGGAIDIGDRIEYSSKEDYRGSLNMLYVREYEANVPTYLLSLVFKNWDLEKMEKSQISDETMEEISVRNRVMLNNSINNAKYVAYKAASKEIEVINKKHVIIGTVVDTNLEIGDEILEVGSKKIEELEDIKEVINNKEIDEEIVFRVRRDDKEIEVIEKIKELDDVKGVGVVFITDYEYKLSPDIELKFKPSESGSSGGLMMAISIYSAISGEDILKGRNIAGTGTIDIKGNVGEIAGVKYKIMGAARNNMDVVLVPSRNYEEAIKTKKDNNYDIEIVKVDNFMDAINYLRD